MLRAILLLSLFNVAAQAAEQSARTCRILFLSAPPDAPAKLHLFDGAASQEVELTRMGFSPSYEIRPGAITLALLPAPPPPATDPKATLVIPADAPKAAIAETIGHFYLIVSSDTSNKIAPVKMQVINADAANFKRGQMLWYNLTDSRVGGIVGSRKLLVEPNSRLILDAPASRAEDYHVNIHFVPPGKQQPEPLCETNWSHDPRSRGVFFILKPNGGLIPRIMGFPDFREPEEKEPAP